MARSIDRRLENLEARAVVPEDELRRGAVREVLRRLTFEESEWLAEPSREAEMLVDCPIHGPGCDCTNEPRRQRAREECPELYEEYGRRWEGLWERRMEIIEREPEDWATSWRRRHGIGA